MSDLTIIHAILNRKPVTIEVRDGLFSEIRPEMGKNEASNPKIPVLDADGKAILPAFYNTHTHAGMSLLRGYADDKELYDWLNNYIWPIEAKLTGEDIYIGARLAAVEMIRSGTVFFNDMYWHPRETIRAVESLGMRACVGQAILDAFDTEQGKRQFKEAEELLQNRHAFSSKIQFNINPHSVYTVRKQGLQWAAEFAASHDIPLHIHVSESQIEVAACLAENGCRPVEWLEQCGVFQARVIAAHGIHVTNHELKIMAKNDVIIAHNPSSNHKLVSGVFPYHRYKKAGIPVTLGTDSSSSNNNLSMMESMKMTALNAKMASGDPKECSAEEVWQLATEAGAKAFRINGGKIETGAVADFILVNTDHPALVPGYNLISDMVYSADSSVIDTVICGGDILMQDRQIPGEKEIIEEARRAVRRLTSSEL